MTYVSLFLPRVTDAPDQLFVEGYFDSLLLSPGAPELRAVRQRHALQGLVRRVLPAQQGRKKAQIGHTYNWLASSFALQYFEARH